MPKVEQWFLERLDSGASPFSAICCISAKSFLTPHLHEREQQVRDTNSDMGMGDWALGTKQCSPAQHQRLAAVVGSNTDGTRKHQAAIPNRTSTGQQYNPGIFNRTRQLQAVTRSDRNQPQLHAAPQATAVSQTRTYLSILFQRLYKLPVATLRSL